MAVLVTDGVSNEGQERTIPEAILAHASGIHIYAVGVDVSSTTELDVIASPPAEINRMTALDFNGLQNVQRELFSRLCSGLHYFISLLHAGSILFLSKLTLHHCRAILNKDSVHIHKRV